jgi:hypothetical protein
VPALSTVQTITEKATETYTDKVTVIRERTHTVTPVESVTTAEPMVARTDTALVEAEPAECPHWSAYDALLQVPVIGSVVERYFARGSLQCAEPEARVTVVEKSVQAGDEPPPAVPVPTPPQATVEDNVEAPATTVNSKADDAVKTTAVAGGVDVDQAETHDGTAVAPEQHEVSGTATVVPEALPRTGGDGAVLTMLGLALIASGAAVRTAARD